MRHLLSGFDVWAVGTDLSLSESFARQGMRYRDYRMSRGVNPLADAAAVRELTRIFRAERPDIVHTFDTKPCVWGRIAAKAARVPVVIGTLPGLGSLYAGPARRTRILRLAYQPLQTIACRISDLTIFQNDDDASEFVRRRVVAPRRVAIVPGSGVDTGEFVPPSRPPDAGARLALGLPTDGLLVVMVSRLLRAKGVLEYAAAARMARELDPTVQFVLVGPADAESVDPLTAHELEEVAAAVSWVGPRSDVNEILRLADVFVFPSFYREGVPRVLLEAASTGLPLVAADVPGSRDVVADGVNGYLVPPRDARAIGEAVLRLAASPGLRSSFGERSRELAVSQFGLAVVAARTGSLYRSLLSARQDG
jgi:glycosyltransferase involved in cell wall biosynthesis